MKKHLENKETSIIENIVFKKKTKKKFSKKKIRIGINGVGRIGRAVLKLAILDKDIEVIVVNCPRGIESLEYFLKYDSAYGKSNLKIKTNKNFINLNSQKIKVISQRNINKINWKKYNIDILIESTGVFRDKKSCDIHLKNGARKIILSSPAIGEGFFFYVRGLNDKKYKNQKLISNCSCTTNSIGCILNEINKKLKIKNCFFTTTHSLTGDQKLLDNFHNDFRRGRSAFSNIVPTSSGAYKSIEKLIPKLNEKIFGNAFRVPTICGSISDLTINIKKNITQEKLILFLKNLCNKNLKGIIDITNEKLVSNDILGNPNSGIIDLEFVKVIDKNFLKISIWYDNEFGFSNRLIEVIKKIK